MFLMKELEVPVGLLSAAVQLPLSSFPFSVKCLGVVSVMMSASVERKWRENGSMNCSRCTSDAGDVELVHEENTHSSGGKHSKVDHWWQSLRHLGLLAVRVCCFVDPKWSLDSVVHSPEACGRLLARCLKHLQNLPLQSAVWL